MDRRWLNLGLPVGAALLGAAAVAVWLSWGQATDLSMRLPAPQDEAESTTVRTSAEPRNPGTLAPGPGRPSADRGTWPQFRGADRSNVARDVRGLARSWPEGGPPVLWNIDVGEGHAGPVIHNGRVFLVDYDREKQEDAIRCLSLTDGAEIWRYSYSVRIKRNHGMSRTVPAVTDDYLVAIGPKCHVHCLRTDSGERVWQMDMVEEFGTVVPPWYAGQCPLIDGDVAILAPGGDPLMMAVELATGEVRWRTPNPGGWAMTHSSVTPMDYHGSRQYVYCTTRGVVGVSAEDGRVLWTKPDWKIALANVPSPVVVGDDRLFLSGGYNSGCTMIRLSGDGDDIITEEVFRLPHTVFGADQHTPVFYDGHIYGVRPGGELACLALDGRLLWTSGAAARFGLGPYVIADGMLFVLNDQSCTLHLAAAAPNDYRELASAAILDGHDAWGAMAVADGRLILRDLTRMVCLDIGDADHRVEED